MTEKENVLDEDRKLEIIERIIKDNNLTSIMDQKDPFDYFDLTMGFKCDSCNEQFYTLVIKTPEQDILPDQIIDELRSCDICGDEECLEFSESGYRSHPEYVSEHTIGKVQEVCCCCIENPMGTVVVITSGGKYKFDAFDGFLTDYEGDFDFLPDNVQKAVEEVVNSMGYRRTDGWRGYYYFDTPPGWKEVLEGWHSSVDETDMSKFITSLGDNGFPIIKVILQTSNVFSVGVDVIVPEDADVSILETEMPPRKAVCYNV